MIIKRNGMGIGVVHLPDLKKPMLAVIEDGCVTKVATFHDEKRANLFDGALRRLLEGLIEDEKYLKGENVR